LSVLLSQALQRPLVNNIAMTGEISLTGKVLPIGGLREKILGARQSNIFHLIVPKANMHDIAELPSFITSGLTIYFAETCDEVIRLVFGAPHVLGGMESKTTLIKKYDTFEGADFEILKMQAQEAKQNSNNNTPNENDTPNNTNDIVDSNPDTTFNDSTPPVTIKEAEIVV
jgi:predicted ATP-dependent protease